MTDTFNKTSVVCDKCGECLSEKAMYCSSCGNQLNTKSGVIIKGYFNEAAGVLKRFVVSPVATIHDSIEMGYQVVIIISITLMMVTGINGMWLSNKALNAIDDFSGGFASYFFNSGGKLYGEAFGYSVLGIILLATALYLSFIAIDRLFINKRIYLKYINLAVLSQIPLVIGCFAALIVSFASLALAFVFILLGFILSIICSFIGYQAISNIPQEKLFYTFGLVWLLAIIIQWLVVRIII